MNERIKHMLIKEFLQVFRDVRMRAMIFIVPVLQTLVFGYAVTTDVRQVATAVYDQDHSVASRELIGRFVKSGYFEILERVDGEKQARELLDKSRVQALLHLGKGFEEAVLAGKKAPIQVILDGTDSNTAAIVLNYTHKIINQYSQELLIQRSNRLFGQKLKPGALELKSRAWFNENLVSRNFYVPGVIALLVMLITLMMTSMAVVREKEIGTMEQIMVTPITPREFVLGKTVPFALIGFVDVILITLVGVFWFEVPIRGNLLLLFLATGIYLLSSLSIGLLISTVSQTQQQAMMSTFFFFFPSVMLSGFVFPIANMPEVVQWITYFNPLRYFLVIIRGIFLKGVGLEVLWPHLAALTAIGLFILYLAKVRFKKTL